MPRFLVAPWVAVVLALGLAAERAEAFCWSSTCKPKTASDSDNDEGLICEPPEEKDCGLPLYWNRECVGYSIQLDASSKLPREQTMKVVARSFSPWLANICRGKSPGIGLAELPAVACGSVEYNSLAGNANVVVFRDEQWPHDDHGQLALTTVTFDKKTGEIYDADIEVNTADFAFSVDDLISPNDANSGEKLYNTFDLQAVLTHEVGHFWGMGHSKEPGSTMSDTVGADGTERTLTEDDKWGMCALYPPLSINTDSCNPIPRHGFSGACEEDQPDHGCMVRRIGDRRGWGGWILLTGLGVVRFVRGRRNARCAGLKIAP